MAVTIKMNDEWLEALVRQYCKMFPAEAKAAGLDVRMTQKEIRLNNPKAMGLDKTSMLLLQIPTRIMAVIHAVDPNFDYSRSRVLKSYFGLRPGKA